MKAGEFVNTGVSASGQWAQKRRAAVMFVLGLAVTAGVAQATPVVIQDNYIGGTPTSSSWNGRDVIGAPGLFDISRMEVSFASANTMYVDIYSRYFDNIGAYRTQLGDLFLSTTGYQGEGEQWEYALVLDTHQPGTSTSGDVTLYGVNNRNIVYSSAPQGYVYRAGQEVQYRPGQQGSLAMGTWELFNLGGSSDQDDYLRFALTYDFGDVPTYGFHWGMTCGNDVIEGAAPVPEPGTMLLFGSGMIGLAGLYRRKAKAGQQIVMG